MKTKAKVLMTAALFMMTAAFILIPQSEISAASGFTVTDGEGTEFRYEAPSEKVMTVGKGLSATVIEIGYIDKILVCDSYSVAPTAEAVYDDLKKMVADGIVAGGGNIYSAGKAQLIIDIVYATENKGFDKAKDTVFITGGSTYTTPIVSELRGLGYEKVLLWTDIPTYEDMMDYVDVVSKVVSGSTEGKAEQMRYVAKQITETLGSREKVNAFYVTYSSGVFKVGNTGSLATSMILAAGGNAITIDDSKAKPTYETSLPILIGAYGTDTIVFVDSVIVSNATNMNNLRTELPGVTLVPLESLWNNFDPDSMVGVWTMASAMYPDLFSGDVPTIPVDDGPDMIVYVIAAAVAVVAICAIGFFFLRRS